MLLLGRVTAPSRSWASAAGLLLPNVASALPATFADPPDDRASFPLSVSGRWRCLEDAAGKPFLIQGDTPWSLVVQLTQPEVDVYLRDRRARGFNTLLVNLIEHQFARNAPANAYGESPFVDKPFAELNDAYFVHADWVLARIAEEGFLVFLAPAYLGYGGGDEGWYRAMREAGPARLKEYGRQLGQRYGHLTNIVWVHCGDYDPPDKGLAEAVAAGIRESDKHSLHTVHGGPETDILDYWSGQPWLDLGNVYTYKPVWIQAAQRWARPDRKPYVLIESAYENEHGATELRLRVQAYQALLTGACGQFFGNNPIWAFNARTAFEPPGPWQEALGSRGSQSMTHLRNLFVAVPWWRLVPDLEGRFLLNGQGRQDDRAVAAVDAHRAFAIVYLPDSRPITIHMNGLDGTDPVARWYDPAAGIYAPAEPWSVHDGTAEFQPPARNAAKFADWVLVLGR
jgi:hypothetical protein